jgi:hypothetical protein
MKIFNPYYWYRHFWNKAFMAGRKEGEKKSNEHGFEQGYKHGWNAVHGWWDKGPINQDNKTVYDRVYEDGLANGKKLAEEDFDPRTSEDIRAIEKENYDRGFVDGQKTRTPAEYEAILRYEQSKVKENSSNFEGMLSYSNGLIKGREEGIKEGKAMMEEHYLNAIRYAKEIAHCQGYQAAEKKFMEKTRIMSARWKKTNKLLNR